ncbi:uncharacterized protein LOC126278668 [Schistocerca gregaria]|uniref:uncharacterized protein LOC126278668 n=1 Tax=Schistocerca gregaria TaxID=7010 RepID=UPI00211F257E|nr:uncharacterized protein LOC126278668 [Schistocerca gregaria]
MEQDQMGASLQLPVGPTAEDTSAFRERSQSYGSLSSEETPKGNTAGKVQTRHSWHGSGELICPTQQTTGWDSWLSIAGPSRMAQEQLPGERPVQEATEFSGSASASQTASEMTLLQEQNVSSTSSFIPTPGPSGLARKRRIGGELFDYQHKVRKEAERSDTARHSWHETKRKVLPQQGGSTRAKGKKSTTSPQQADRERRGEYTLGKQSGGSPFTASETSETGDDDSEEQ